MLNLLAVNSNSWTKISLRLPVSVQVRTNLGLCLCLQNRGQKPKLPCSPMLVLQSTEVIVNVFYWVYLSTLDLIQIRLVLFLRCQESRCSTVRPGEILPSQFVTGEGSLNRKTDKKWRRICAKGVECLFRPLRYITSPVGSQDLSLTVRLKGQDGEWLELCVECVMKRRDGKGTVTLLY